MTLDEWRVIVDWDLEDAAERELDGWLRRHNVTRPELDPDIRVDATRSFDGVQRVRYSLRSGIRLPAIDRPDASEL